jgi:hypothetical protein
MTIRDMMFQWKLQNRTGRPRFYPVRTKPFERGLHVKSKGRGDGRRDYPPEHATEPGSAEMAILEAYGALQLSSTEHYKSGASVYRSLVSDARSAWQGDPYGNLASDAGRECQDIIRDALLEVRESWEHYARVKDQLAHFRDVHGLRYEPIRYEERFWKLSVIAAVMMGESILNARMFALASGEGWAGGFSEALLISAASVGFSAGCGYGMTLANATSFLMSRVGMAARLVWGPVTVFLHLLTGHYRDSLMALAVQGGVVDSMEAGRQAMASLLAHPLALQDYHSLLLVLLGLMASVIAACEGYRLDDPYPGYGEAARRVAIAKRNHADLKASVLARVKDVVEEARDEVRAAYETAQAKLAAFGDELRHALDFLRKYAGMTQFLRASCARMIRLYRECNVRERSEKPPPYFSQDIDVPIAMDPELASDLADAEAMMRDFQSPEALRELRARANDAEAALDALETRFRNEALEAFARIEQEPAQTPPVQSNGHAALMEINRHESQV